MTSTLASPTSRYALALTVMYAGLFAAGAWLFSRVPEPPVDAVASDIRRA